MADTDVKWIKISTNLFGNEKMLLIQAMPDADALMLIWIRMLCLAGNMNKHGVFKVHNKPYTDEMFASVLNRPVNTVRLALATFADFGMLEQGDDGAYRIRNWDKYQSLDALEKKREYQKNLMRERRAAQKALCETNCDANSETNCDANVSRLEEIRTEETRKDEKRLDENLNQSRLPDYVALIKSCLRAGLTDGANMYWKQATAHGIHIDVEAIKASL